MNHIWDEDGMCEACGCFKTEGKVAEKPCVPSSVHTVMTPGGMIPLKDCVKGDIYKLKARNFSLGVFDGKDGFIGIRSKFMDRYLFTEIHYEADDHYGTAVPLEQVGRVTCAVNASGTNKDLFAVLDAMEGRV